MDNRTEQKDQLIEKGAVTGMRPGSEIVQPKTQNTERTAVKTVSKEEAEIKLINRPKAKNVTPLASMKLTPDDIPVFEDTPERREKLA